MQPASLYFFDKFGENYNFQQKISGISQVYDITGTSPVNKPFHAFVQADSTSGDGTGAEFDLYWSPDDGWRVEVVTEGSSYKIGDTVTILGTSLPAYLEASAPSNNIIFKVGTPLYGREWIKPISVGLFDSRQIFILEKTESGYYFPQLNPGERLTFKWANYDPENPFFFYKVIQNTAPDADTNLPYISKIESISLSHEDLDQGGFGSIEVQIPMQVNLAFSPLEEKIYERKLECYLETISSGGISKIAILSGTAAIDVNHVNSTYTEVSSTALTGSGVGAKFNIFRNGTEYIVTGIPETGSGYSAGDQVLINGSQIGGVSGANNLTLVVVSTTNFSVTDSVKLLEIDYYGEGDDEDERYRIWLENFGISFHVEDAQLLKDYNINEGNPDWEMINYARKQFLVNRDQVLPYVGTYKGLSNFINLFDYKGTLEVKEYWKNINKKSPALDQFALVNITDFLDDGKIDDMEYVSRGGAVQDSEQFKKTAFLALCYQFTKTTGNYDDDGLPEVVETTQFSPDEIFYKLFGLARKVKREILPINVVIKDIIGEFIFFEKFSLRDWTDDTQVKDISINYKYKTVVALPDKSIATANIRDIKPLFPSPEAEDGNPKKQLAGFPKYSFNLGTVVPYSKAQIYSPEEQASFVAAVETYYNEVRLQEWTNHGHFYYWNEGNINKAEQIGCPIILEAVLPRYTLADYADVLLSELETENTTVIDLDSYLNLVDIEWTITKPGPNQYNWSFRGNIRDFRKIAHILPYTGEYLIETTIYDQFAGISVDFIRFKVNSTVPSLVGYARTSDKFSYRFKDLTNVSVGDLGNSPLFNLNVTIPSFTQRINTIDLDDEIFNWQYYADGFTNNTSPLNAKVKDDLTGEFIDITSPLLRSNQAKYWGIGNNSLKPRVSDLAGAQLGELFHTKFYQMAYQSDFLQGILTSDAELVPGALIKIGLYEPYIVKYWQTVNELIDQLNSTPHPAISKFRFRAFPSAEDPITKIRGVAKESSDKNNFAFTVVN